MPSWPKNYDDWNEAFWSNRSLWRLKTKSGKQIMAAAPEAQWRLVLAADWKAFFDTSPKTFRELRWWACLLVSNSRIYLLHATSFLLSLIYAWPAAMSNDFNGWGRQFLMPYVAISSRPIAGSPSCHRRIPATRVAATGSPCNRHRYVLVLSPLFGAASAFFAAWSNPTDSTNFKTLKMCLLRFLLVVAAAVFISVIQSARSRDQLDLEPLRSSWVLSYLFCWLVVVVFGLHSFVVEMSPRNVRGDGAFDTILQACAAATQPPARPPCTCHVLVTAVDSNSQWEETMAHLWEAWVVAYARRICPSTFTRKGHRLAQEDSEATGALPPRSGAGLTQRHELVALLRMYSFWAAVWVLKTVFCCAVLLPAALEAHSSLVPALVQSPTNFRGERLEQWPEPVHMLRSWLLSGVWVACFTCYVADTLLWYQIVLALSSGVSGVWERGVHYEWSQACCRHISASYALRNRPV